MTKQWKQEERKERPQISHISSDIVAVATVVSAAVIVAVARAQNRVEIW